ncbi:hypothetical protein JANAI62_23390 [Jannaschia pagri]|uniref:Glycosyl transferase n=1 Tax=Jannaschia pagri TaxID=2829797 RepID=A0ABQ4NMW8_9RHOB|nr:MULTISPECIES: hypothetical protein [unclassified Jannaschia]GIT91882.1 hypothetical protein JANAI61_23400 [Jannaschia sp. AI_61]GIT95716.1 hypothetical protein JANAI62_23390 [Jannaschia sp. AI_62]
MDANILIVAQRGRLLHEAVLFAATLRHHAPLWSGRLLVAEPQPGPRWSDDPRLPEGPQLDLLRDLGAEILPFETNHFGSSYPQGNKIEALAAAPAEPFVFFDTDTVITGDLATLDIDVTRPSASMKRENTWPTIELYGPGYTEIWGALHRRRGNRLEDTLDLAWPDEHWRRYLYFNAGWFFGADAHRFHRAFLDAALMIRDDPPSEIAVQTLDPWLDQAALPLAIQELGGGRPGDKGGIADGVFDGTHSFHYRFMPLMYATAPDHVIEAVEAAAAPNRIKRVLKDHEPFKRFIYQPKGAKARALFDRANLPRKEQAIRNRLKRENLWVR